MEGDGVVVLSIAGLRVECWYLDGFVRPESCGM